MGKKDTKNSSIRLESLSLNETVYLYSDADHRLYFQHDLDTTYGMATRARVLSHGELVALGLTEVCCKVGKGKVCLHPRTTVKITRLMYV